MQITKPLFYIIVNSKVFIELLQRVPGSKIVPIENVTSCIHNIYILVKIYFLLDQLILQKIKKLKFFI